MKAGFLLAGAAVLAGRGFAAAKQPNILFILTDDMDSHMEALAHMPLLQKHLVNEGTVFSRHYCTVALCCPSRVNLLTGRAAHNTNVTDVWAPYGGYPKVVREGINDDYLPIWMQQAGYNTYYAGKIWNQHSVENYNEPFVGGFNESDFLLDPFTYEYWNATMTRNGAPPVSYEGQYSPDLTAIKAYDFLREAMMHEQPWFVVHAPIAPHGNVHFAADEDDEAKQSAPKYAARHAHLFKDYKIPRDENFNPAVQDGVSWIAKLPLLNDTVIEYNDEFQRSRLRALQSVDESTAALLQLIDDAGELDNTYIFYTTDNGYHISQHRMHPGKECGFETDVHIPMIVRGPGVARGHVSQAVTSHTDIASTIMELAGRPLENTDGSPMPLSIEAEVAASKTEHVNIEYWGLAIPEGELGRYGDANMTDDYGAAAHAAENNTYKGLRVIGDGYNLYYAVWCTNETELYDLVQDPFEVRNLLGTNHTDLAASLRIADRPIQPIVNRLNALVVVLKTCARDTCREPWKALHPQGDVASLHQALNAKFDDFYATQPRVYFTKCEIGYLADSEGPNYVNQFGGGIHEGHISVSATNKGGKQEGYNRKALDYLGPQHRISIWT
ncbi:hypothetical protein Sste5346_009605 [Sporothrix stenoceras]|uniref:Arylsulfatase n=1 Tax=Sporothrix stenoceras TaxID=5173 RepID=A0ABR3YKL0_9PEZI